MTPLLAVVVVTVTGLPLAYVLTRSIPLAALLAPLMTALMCTLAVVLMIAIGGSLLPWLALVVAAQIALLGYALRRRPADALPRGSWVDAVWLAVPLLPPTLQVLSQPIEWDAHSIWWNHAGLYVRGSDFVRYALSSQFQDRADYPPLPSAPVGMVWSLFSAYNFRVAQVVSTLITFSAIAMVGYSVRRVTDRAPAIASRLAAAGVSLATWATAGWCVTAGYSDALWAASFTAAAVLLLYGRDPLTRPALPLTLLTVAALSKNEGFIAVLLLTVALTIRHRLPLRQLWRLWRLWLPVTAGAVWSPIITRLLDTMHPTAPAPGLIRRLLEGDPAIVGRISPSLAAIWKMIGVIGVFAFAAALLGTLLLRRQRRELGMGADVWMWLVGLGYLGSLLATYATSTFDIRWQLATSVDRVTTPLALMASASAASWAIVALTAMRKRRSPAAQEQQETGAYRVDVLAPSATPMCR